ncbi:sulfatase [Haloferax sp. Atlit-12N]|uniref:sulfatase-like hydrolase/transferase n=1 Tax=Haloferax sp. Atlit-12N TaxID=2077203 RepID=UPI000E269C56|nr:sulfatase-like hydrolase/transferase [Haloferax sp. Atlit-12N]RDZ61679.1 sulfatase [Haloferax sp. Atlit-12N]
MRNVVLICLDTVRKDFFDSFSSRLRERADIVYDQCRTASTWSAPSHASMFTGTLPHQHGVHAYHRDFSGIGRDDTFLADLPDHRALGVSANVWAGSSFGFDGFFDEFSNISPDRRFPEGIDVARFGQSSQKTGLGKQLEFLKRALEHEKPIQSLLNGVAVQVDNTLATAPVPKPMDDGAKTLIGQANRLVGASSEPFFLFTNFMDAHGPLRHILGYDRDLHDAPNSWSSEHLDWSRIVAEGDETEMTRYRDLYGAAIDYLDRKVCTFIDEVQSMTDEETTFVVTSDHGDNLAFEADGGLWGHTESSLNEALTHVPLVVVNSPSEGTDVVDGYVSHLRLGDLLVGLARGECPDVTDERIPVERIGHSGKQHKLAEQERDTNRMLRAVYDGDRKFVWADDGSRETYRLDADRPCWQAGIDDSFDAESLDESFFETPVADSAERARSAEDELGVDGATADRLRELGYL